MDNTSIVYITAEVVVGVMSVIGNSIVIAAIWKNRRLHTITNVFVGNLAMADIVVGLLAAPCAALAYKGLPKNFYGCVFINSVILIVTNISILMLLGVALERFLAIKEPFLYQRTLTVRRAIYINSCIWVIGFLLGMVPMYGWNKGAKDLEVCLFTNVITYEYMVYFQFFGLVLLPLFLMMCIYIYILIIVRRHMKQTNALRNMFQQERRAQEGFSKDVKAAKMLALVILFFGIFWLPVNILNSLSLFCDVACSPPYEVLLAAIVMSHANSCINPFLYAASNSRIKRAIKGIFGIKVSPEDNSTDINQPRHTNNLSPTPNHVSERSDQEEGRVLPFTISQDKFLQLNRKMSVAGTPLDDSDDNLEVPGTSSEPEGERAAPTEAKSADTNNIKDSSLHSILKSSLFPSSSESDNLNLTQLTSLDSSFNLTAPSSESQNNKLNGHIHPLHSEKDFTKNKKNLGNVNVSNHNNEIYAFLENSESPELFSKAEDGDAQQWCWPANEAVPGNNNEDTASINCLLGVDTSYTKDIDPADSGGQITNVVTVPDNARLPSKGNPGLLELKQLNGFTHLDLDLDHFDIDPKKGHAFILDLEDNSILAIQTLQITCDD
uniref:G-protein coupled receptors family 1 profile domain-containing protein n=1 Tax=Biomphalaria glabrata TaxID=6526 RepID=A0A2C9K1H0_BIOGL